MWIQNSFAADDSINYIYEVIEQPIDYVLKDYVEDMTANRQKAEDGIYQGKQTSEQFDC